MPRPRLEGLTPRRLEVLAAVVREYIETGRPVGSETVRRKYSVAASAATIRNDFAALQKMGLVEKPHHSAGRVPTAAGYRVFVERIMTPRLRPAAQTWLRSRLRRASELAEAVAEAVSALAEVTRLAALATLPPKQAVELESVNLRQISGNVAVLTYKLSDGTGGDVLLELPRPLSAGQQAKWGRALMEAARTGPEGLAAASAPAPEFESAWDTAVEQILTSLAGRTFVDGTAYLAARPEMRQSEALANLLEIVQHRGRAYRLLASVRPGQPGALFGAPDTGGRLPGCAVIVDSFGGRQSWGRVAVVGPMRMDYERAVAAAAEVADLLTEAWQSAAQYEDARQ